MDNIKEKQKRVPKGHGKSIIYSYSKEEMQILLDTSQSYREVLEKIGLNPRGGNPETLKKYIKEFNLNENKLEQNRKEVYFKNGLSTSKKLKIPIEQILKKGIKIRGYKLLKRLEKEGIKEHKCEICGITEWQGKPISLQLHHKDGDNTNQELENLQILCPNCHSQTDNYAGKSSKRAQKKKYFCPICGKEISKGAKHCIKCASELRIKSKKLRDLSRDELKKLIREKSFSELGNMFGITGNNVKKYCKKVNLPSTKREINSYSDEEWDKI